MFNTQPKPETTTDETTQKDVALAEIAAAKIALARAESAVANAVASTEIKPCGCLPFGFAKAMGVLESIENEVTGKGDDGDGDVADMIMAMLKKKAELP